MMVAADPIPSPCRPGCQTNQARPGVQNIFDAHVAGGKDLDIRHLLELLQPVIADPAPGRQPRQARSRVTRPPSSARASASITS